MRSTPLCVLVLVSTLSGCAGPVAPEDSSEGVPGSASGALTSDNGTSLNGTSLNGTSLNGTDLTGFLVSVNYNPTKLNGTQLLDNVWLEGTTFKGVHNGTTYSGADFVQAELQGNLGDGSTVRLRVRSISPAPAPNEDVSLYNVEYRAEDLNWYPACRDSSGTPTLALPVQGVWDYRQGVEGGGSKLEDPARFTFACLGAAVAKCALWGYRPWAEHNGVSLAAHHQACTRLVRADYCGTGTPYTQDGNLINLYDYIGIQQDTEDWVFEAEWDENGARCFYALNRSSAGIPCYDERVDELCGVDLTTSRGALLVNETPGDGITTSSSL